MIRTTFNPEKYIYKYNIDSVEIYSNIKQTDLHQSVPTFATTNTLNNKIIEKILNPSILKFIINNKDVVAIALGGSQALNLQDEWSDYDLTVIVKNDKWEDGKNNFYMIVNDIGIHWYYIPYEWCINFTYNQNVPLDLVRYFSLLQNKYIYINDLELVKQIKNNIGHLATLAASTFANSLKEDILTRIVKQRDIPKTKYVYHLCVASHILANTKFNKNQLVKVKRLKYTSISKKTIKYCYDRAILLVNQLAEIK